ncbi:MAG TPA: S46 family peptidase [Vicinamibacteria bacterium]|nr:S46 family peptidase [Vicinamibacteria bacterium]
MKSRRVLFTLLPALALGATLAVGDEGMWMPQQIPDLAATLKTMGFQGDPKAFADLTGHPMGAVVSLGGCTASFVSPEGLIVTNHHCVQGSLQYNSTPERNLLSDGFLAKTRAEELWNGPGSRVSVTVSVREVTEQVLGKMPAKLTDRERYALIDRRVKEQTAACEKEGLRCRVASFFQGLRYYEIAQMEIQDVRLVYAPAAGIGNFGGETDNWQWPRHVGDFSFYRAYVGKDGKPAAFSKDNVPYAPKHHLRVSPQGAGPGELVFVAGYPGFTARHQTFAQVKDLTEWGLPRSVRRAQEQIAILTELSKEGKDLEIKAATRIRGLNNGLTKNKGVLEGLVKGGMLGQKEASEKELLAWIAADPMRQKDYGDVMPALAAIQAEVEKTRERDATFSALYAASPLLGSASNLYRLSRERAKKDLDREGEFQERNWARMKEGQQRMQRTLDARIDRALLRYVMLEAAGLPAAQRIAALDQKLGLTPGTPKEEAQAKIEKFLDGLLKESKLIEEAYRLSLFEATPEALANAKDPVLELAIALAPLDEEIRERSKTRQGALARLSPRAMKATLAQKGGLVAPDANSTLRVTFGQVKGVSPKDGMAYLPQTTVSGVAQKHTGKGEFNAPRRQLDAIKALASGKTTPFADAKLGSVPVDFLSTVDTTGGNSGSPTLNSKGELVGLLFDGTYDTVASDYLFDPVNTRSIHVDSRYMLWVMSEVDGAGHLLHEMGIR